MTTSRTDVVTRDDALGGTRMAPPPETTALPLRFVNHGFEAHCYNTSGCHVDYAGVRAAGPTEMQDPDTYRSFSPSSSDYKERWGFASHIGIRNFPPPAEVHWTSLDGAKHEARVDIAKIFKDQLAWHRVSVSDYAKDSFDTSASIYLEVNDRTINVYTKAFLGTKAEQIPGNKHSYGRDDLFLVWTRTY